MAKIVLFIACLTNQPGYPHGNPDAACMDSLGRHALSPNDAEVVQIVDDDLVLRVTICWNLHRPVGLRDAGIGFVLDLARRLDRPSPEVGRGVEDADPVD